MISRFASPGDAYLLSIGELVYAVSSMEWTILGDLGRLSPHLPPGLTVESLAHKTTGTISRALAKALPDIADGGTHAYLEVGARALSKAATIRNHVLHARPATIADAQRLYRWTAGGPDGAHAFPVTTEYLDDALHRLRALSDTIEAARPPL